MIRKNLLGTLRWTVLLLLWFETIQSNQQVLYDIDFVDDFAAFDPRSSNSAFEFGAIDNSTGMRQDNAAFLRGKTGKVVYMLTVPMIQWLPQSFGIGAVSAQFDGAARAKQPLKVGRAQILNASLSFTCRTVNVRLNKFPKGAVTNANDDPRLASCALSLVDIYKTGLQFSIQLTNQGVWGKYAKDSVIRAKLNSDFTSFTVYRRLASRNSASELVEARIEVDRRAQQTRYFVNNELVWTVQNLGRFTKSLYNRNDDDYDRSGRRRFNRLVSYNRASSSSRESDQPSKFSLFIENTRALDVADPNRIYDKSETGGSFSPALVRVTNLAGFYNPKVKFYDENSERYSSLWGQGAVAGLKTLRVEISGAEHNGMPSSRVAATEANVANSLWRNRRRSRYATLQKQRALNGKDFVHFVRRFIRPA